MLQENLQRRTAAAESMTTALMSSTPSPRSTATPISSGTPSVTVTESTTQSTVSGPEEPSLRNVVTAAEDFIKVLATVSTSQSSTADSEKGETQSSEKKKRKNTGKKKKTNKKQKGKGKGRKRKQKAEPGVKIEEGNAVSTSGSKAEGVNALSNFISEPHKHNQSGRKTHRVSDSEYELVGREETSNEVMKDEPAVDKDTVSITSPATVQKKPAELTPPTTTSTATNVPQKAKTRRLRKGGRKRSKAVPLSSSEELAVNTTDISVPTIITISPAAQSEQQSFGKGTEKRPLVGPAKIPIVSSKVKRNRSKERGEREGRKKRRKDSSAFPIVASPHENSSADNLKVIPLTGAPTVPSESTTQHRVSHRLDIYGGKTFIQAASLNSSFSVVKRQKSQEKELRGRRRKTGLPLSSENPPFHNSSGNVLPDHPTPQASDAPHPPTPTAIRIRPTENTETHSEWRLFTATRASPSVTAKRHRQTIRQQRKPRKKAEPAALSSAVPTLKQTEQTPMTFTTAPSKVTTTEEFNVQRSEKTSMTTSAPPVMSPIQLSIERAKAQFSRKKGRKTALTLRQQ